MSKFNSRFGASRQRKPFVPRDIQHARNESARRLDRDYPEFLRPLHYSYSERLPLVFHHFAQGRNEHTNETKSQSHAELSNICDDLVDRSYALLEAHPDYKNLYNVASFFKDLRDWHHSRSQHYSRLHQQEQPVEPAAVEPQQPQQMTLPGTEPQRTPRVC